MFPSFWTLESDESTLSRIRLPTTGIYFSARFGPDGVYTCLSYSEWPTNVYSPFTDWEGFKEEMKSVGRHFLPRYEIYDRPDGKRLHLFSPGRVEYWNDPSFHFDEYVLRDDLESDGEK